VCDIGQRQISVDQHTSTCGMRFDAQEEFFNKLRFFAKNNTVFKVVQNAMVLLVASVPVALALMVTTTLALGSRELV
jgi:magnesium-transporting ATPase (P-type)